MDDDRADLGPGHATAEEAALDGFPDAAHARVLSIVHGASTARALVDTVPSHPMSVTVLRDERGRWHFGSDGNVEPAHWPPPSAP